MHACALHLPYVRLLVRTALKNDGIPITSPSYWLTATDAELGRVFRSESSKEGIPLLDDRIRLLRGAGAILCEVGPLTMNGSPRLCHHAF